MEHVAAPALAQEPKTVEAVAPALAQEPKTVERVVELPAAVPPSSEAPAAPVAAAKPSRPAPVQPVELPLEPTGELEVASPLELIGSGAESSWSRRAIEVDFSSEEAGLTGPGASDGEGEIQLASVHEFIPTWDPSAEPVASEVQSSEPPADTSTSWQTAGAGAPDGSADGEAQILQQVQLQDALDALRQATTRGELGKALLSFVQGRFPRGFLLGETFGFARVGQGFGPGSDKPEVAALQVDLEAPSLLAMAAAGGRAVVSSMPESPLDEVLFATLGESFSHLMAAPIRLNQRTVGFVVIDGGPSPFGPEELDELDLLIAEASQAYGRLHDSSM